MRSRRSRLRVRGVPRRQDVGPRVDLLHLDLQVLELRLDGGQVDAAETRLATLRVLGALLVVPRTGDAAVVVVDQLREVLLRQLVRNLGNRNQFMEQESRYTAKRKRQRSGEGPPTSSNC